MRLIDADVLKQHIDKLPALPDGNFAGSHSALKALINMQPTVQPEERTEKRTETHASDLISRQVAIRWVKTECNPYGKPTLDFESGKRVMKHLEQMPPAQQEQKLIPCSETVDIPDHEIMACDRYGEFIIGYLDYKDEQWICESDSSLMYDPVAWCELPKAYKEVTE